MISTLIHTESGLVVPEFGEELAMHRRARKVLSISSVPNSSATLYCLARRHTRHEQPMRVSVNGREVQSTVDGPPGVYLWTTISIPPQLLVAGPNRFEFWANSPAQDAWTLAMESGHPNPASFLSFDAGRTWQNERMGVSHRLRGEYIVRLRVPGVAPQSPVRVPEFVWEDPKHPRLAELRQIVPAEILSIPNTWARARALASWVSQRWKYANSDDGARIYTPWDPLTILSWSQHRTQVPDKAVAMCVHYAVLFTSCAIACGIPARCVATTGDWKSMNGHFVAEVWHEKTRTWAMIDPNVDMAFVDRDRPLGVFELYDRRADLKRLAQPGPGTDFHRPRLSAFLDQHVLTAACYRLCAVWPRNDFLSRPDLTPPAHGDTAYCETGFVWNSRHVAGSELDMFPHITGDEWFARHRPPPLAASQTR